MSLTSWVFQPQLLANKFCYENGSLTIMDELMKDGFQPSPDLKRLTQMANWLHLSNYHLRSTLLPTIFKIYIEVHFVTLNFLIYPTKCY